MKDTRIKKGQHLSPLTEFKKGLIPPLKGKHRSKESIEKQKETIRNRSKEKRKIISENISKISKGRHNCSRTKFKKGQIPWNKGLTKYTDERVAKYSEKQKETKKNPEVLKRMLGFSKPNYKELSLLDILNNIYPNEWKYVGDGSFIINGKNPDFINCNGKKLIIELFGEHWHKPEDENIRINIFKEYGYNTLIIWAKELKYIEKLKEKLNLFNKGV